jgi:hypothetical protein
MFTVRVLSDLYTLVTIGAICTNFSIAAMLNYIHMGALFGVLIHNPQIVCQIQPLVFYPIGYMLYLLI